MKEGISEKKVQKLLEKDRLETEAREAIKLQIGRGLLPAKGICDTGVYTDVLSQMKEVAALKVAYNNGEEDNVESTFFYVSAIVSKAQRELQKEKEEADLDLKLKQEVDFAQQRLLALEFERTGELRFLAPKPAPEEKKSRDQQ